jgi:hypothetical protein
MINWLIDHLAAWQRAWDVRFVWPKCCKECAPGQAGIAFYDHCCNSRAWVCLGSYDLIQAEVVKLHDPNLGPMRNRK